MALEWWTLPGPVRWLEGVVRSLRAGCSVILQLPHFSPGGLREALERQVVDGGSWRWTPIWLDGAKDGEQRPAPLIWKRFADDRPAGAVTAVTLARSDHLVDQVVWLEGLDTQLWPHWEDFLSAYTEAVLERDSWDRGLFVACCYGQMGREPKSNVGLSYHRLIDFCGHLDMTLWTATRLPGLQGRRNEERLRVAIIAELAGADSELADELLQLDLETLLDPADRLSALAAERGWCPASGIEPDWAAGTLHYIDGQPRVHSLLLALSAGAGQDELQRRIWRAQVAVLFPFLEQERVQLLEQLRPMLRPIDRWDNGERRDVQELELAHILAQVRSRVERPLRWRLQHLVEIRNALAHLRPADATLVRAVFRAVAG